MDALKIQVAMTANTMSNRPADLTGPTPEDMMIQGVELAMRHKEDNSDSVFKRFSSAQKAKICGVC